MADPIQFNITFKKRALETIKYAINYYSFHVVSNSDRKWVNNFYKKIKFDDFDNLIFSWNSDKDCWYPDYGDDISDLFLPFVEKGEIFYNSTPPKTVRVIYFGNNKSRYITSVGNVEETAEDYECQWELLRDLPIIKHLVFNYIIEEAKFNSEVYLNGLIEDYGLSYNLVEDIVYLLIGKKLIKGIINNSSKKIQIEEIKSLNDLVSVCSVCSGKLLEDDIFCSYCGAKVG